MKKLMYSSAGLLVIALAFLAFNMLAQVGLSDWRLDLTEQKLYTISAGTEKVLAEIRQPVELYFFYSDQASKDLPTLRTYAKRVEEMLKAYERAAEGKPAAYRRSAAVLGGRGPGRRVWFAGHSPECRWRQAVLRPGRPCR